MTVGPQPFAALEAPACVLDRANLDTDQIVPARFLRKPRSAPDGYAPFLFRDLEGLPPGARPAEGAPAARILLTGPNFGCGSSREGAVYALVDAGVRAVVAESFGDIFRANAARNGLLCVRLSAAQVAALMRSVTASPQARLRIDLPEQTVAAPGVAPMRFEIESFSKQLLVAGQDEIGFTLARAAEIAAFAAQAEAERPWLVPPPERLRTAP